MSTLAAQLGNPESIRLPALGPPWLEGSVQFVYCKIDDECLEATCTFIYQGDRERYDIGFRINIDIMWNDDEGPDCIENVTLSHDGYMSVKTFQATILPLINTDELSPISIRENYFTVLTVNGSPQISTRPPPPDIIYRDIPNDIALPLVTRSDLRRYHINAGTLTMDIVTISSDPSNSLYAYKHHGIFRPPEDDPLLDEVKLLDRVHSPSVLRPAFIVADASRSRFRGYLLPFLPAGSLLRVIRELSVPSGPPDVPVPDNLQKLILRPKLASEQSVPIVVQFLATKLPWTIKLTWAIEATIGVDALHELGIYTGDIKLSNILLDRAGHLQLIDIYPTGGFTPEYAAPEVTIERRAHSQARDVFALGMVLWSIAEEIWYFGREVQSVRPELVWRNGTDSTPHWFRDLVERCLDEEEGQRPTAKEILEILRLYT